MAQNDIQLWDNGSGVAPEIRHARMNASEAFRMGEPVYIGADGDLNETKDDAAATKFAGIALAPAFYKKGGTGAGTGTTTNLNPRTGAPYTTGDMIPYAVCRPGVTLISANFATDGAGTLVAPTLSNALGETAGFTEASNAAGAVYSIDTGVTNDDLVRIIDVLDTNKNSIQDPSFSGNTGVYVVATVIQSQFALTGDPGASN